MKIKRIMLQNIRSYDISEIEFPEGNVLLSGDIGSGKSSVLLAVEFALFGLQRGVGGNILLRNGKNVGGVKLDLEIDGKNIRIERVLKKNKDSIKQDSSYIEIDGVREQLSSTELKSRVLSLLNYPQEYVSKNPIIYRYTVYTPQEEMKNILTEDSSLRLDTLRRVFGIDRYKRIIENSEVLSAHLREKIKESEGQIMDLGQKKDDLSSKTEEVSKIHKEVLLLNNRLEEASGSVRQKREKIEDKEKEISKLNKLRNEFSSVSSELKIKSEQKSQNLYSLHEIEAKIKNFEERTLGRSFDEKAIEEISSRLKAKEAELNQIDKLYIELTRSSAGEEANKSRLQRITREINSLQNCPTCRQKVSPEHKHDIDDKTRKEILEIDAKISDYKKQKEDLEVKKKGLILEINNLRLEDRNAASIKAEIEFIKNSKNTLKRFEEIDKKLAYEISVFASRKESLEKEISSLKDLEKVYSSSRRELEEALDGQKQLEIMKARNERRFEDLNELIKKLEKEISDKEKIKLGISRTKKVKEMISANFTALVEEIEKAVMNKVHAEFSDLFGKWFGMLAEGLNARINNDFTPVIEQQGYEIEYNHLSGGERTAAALAYRLALNQVINSIMSDIKTKDILILDEPTDGFSFEQLDRMRDVLNELKTGQIILVSHETKIESFVDRIIRFQKDNFTKVMH